MMLLLRSSVVRVVRPKWVLALLLLLPLSGQAIASPLRVGVATMPTNGVLEIVVAKAKAQGLEVKIVEFSDWSTPNIAVSNGDLDLNYFQHLPFLEDSISKAGYKLVPVGLGYSTTNGIYSKKIKSLGELKDGATIAIANDAINTGRALALLQEAGLLKLKPDVGYRATIADILDNPRKLKIVQVDGPQISRSLDDVDAAVTYPAFAKLGGLDPNTPVLLEKPNDLYALRFVTRPDRAQDPQIKRFIEIYQTTPEVKETLKKYYGNVISFPWERDQAAVTR
ncbi:MetQ/NlpA family ABC transporter substrate-binding protein [Bradyrhizobium sp. HKCCYLR20261]|uniref:MetQ/NlpA family ABC transporter substrate-binding protein n=1 Tax=Bradyrhizobium sp. HKCCYLR20261 TaxID=3420760 RepID=UPI003EC0603C